MSPRIRVMLADDHAVVRAGYRFLLENVQDIEVVAEASSGEEALAHFAQVNPDVLVIDLTMPGIGGMEAIRQLRLSQPQARILVFSMHENSALVERALQEGASGYISKNSPPDTLVTAVRRIASGNVYIDSELAQNMVVQQSRGQREALAGLSSRELQILRLFAEARAIEDIAESLSLSSKTIANYLTQIKDKLNVNSSAELVRLAISKGLVTLWGILFSSRFRACFRDFRPGLCEHFSVLWLCGSLRCMLSACAQGIAMAFPDSRLSRAIRIALCGSALALGSNTANAQAPGIEVIVVTPVQGQTVARERLAANVQTAAKEDIARSHEAELGAFLNRNLGSVHINDIQNNPFQPDVNFRGFTASPLLGTAQGLSVYLDGVRLNQPFGDVLSWDLIPEAAIESVTLMPGSNPLFGLNTLGGALSLRTKDGVGNAGTSLQALRGQYGRQALEFEHGGSVDGMDWYLTGNRYSEDGWRDDSPSEVRQVFGKVGFTGEQGSLTLTAALADNDLQGNALQEQRMLAAARESVYTKPDITANRGVFFNVAATHDLNASWSVAGNAWLRKIETGTFNGDLNDDTLDQSLYQPSAAERAALTAAGYTGFPVSGETPANTPFPKWRCIGQALLNDEPGEKCNGMINTTSTDQDHYGFNLQASSAREFSGRANVLIVGMTLDASEVAFEQGAELGYLNPDRSITPVGAIADGEHAGEVDGAPFDARVDLNANTSTWSLFATDTIELDSGTHLTLSARYNDTRVENRDGINPGGGTGSLDGDHEFQRMNAGVGLTHRLSAGITAYAGLNQGSRAPSAVELGCADPASPCKLPNAMAGDPPLNQVVASTAEVGLRSAGEISWNLGAYRTDSKDDILFVADDTAGFGYFRNFGKTRRQGIEAGISTALAGVTLGANYTFIDATYRSAEVLGGEGNSSNEQAEAGFPGVESEIEIGRGDRMPLIPRQMLKLYADYPLTSTFSINGDVVAVAGSYARGNENNGHEADGVYYLGPGATSGYAVLNLGAEWQPTQQLNVFLQVNNALDREYASAAQLGSTGFTASGIFQAQPFAANAQGERPLVHSTFFAPGAPRTAWLGVRYRFQ